MAYLGRKFTLSKWSEVDDCAAADGITYCLRTSANSLSFWLAESLDDKAINDIVLAFVANGEKLEKIDIVLIDEVFFTDNGINLESTDGITKVEDLVPNHRDITGLNIRKLEIISREILRQTQEFEKLSDEDIEKYTTIKIFTRQDVKNIILDAIASNRLDDNLLSDKLRAKLN